MSLENVASHEKNFWNVWDSVQGGGEALGDIRLAGFILQNWFAAEPVSIGSIGIPSRAEFLALNALVDPAASFVVLGTSHTPEYRSQLNDLIDILRYEGYPIRTQIADLTLPGRWAKLLPALAVKDTGILRVEASWAILEPKFWENLRGFIKASSAIVCVRGALDFNHPEASVAFLRGMPPDSGIDLIAATSTSLWFAPAGDAAKLIGLLTTSGLFGADRPEADAAKPIIVQDQWQADIVNNLGRFPIKVYSGSRDATVGIEFAMGWALPETDGRWTDGETASATITLPAGRAVLTSLSVGGNGWVPPNDSPQVVELGVGRKPKSWTELHFTDGGEIKCIDLAVAPSDIVNNNLALQIRVQKPGRPSDYGEPDSRVLGFKFRSLALFT